MNEISEYPLKLEDAFSKTISIRRASKVSSPVELELAARIKVLGQALPETLEVHLELKSADKDPFDISLELIGKFHRIEGSLEPDSDVIDKFVTERALVIMWPLMRQIVRQTTALMGVSPPVMIPVPSHFALQKLPEIDEPAST